METLIFGKCHYRYDKEEISTFIYNKALDLYSITYKCRNEIVEPKVFFNFFVVI